MLITIYNHGKRKIIGEIVNRIFYKEVKKSKHLLRKLDAWGFDYKAFIDYVFPQAGIIMIYDKEEHKYYSTVPSVFGKIEKGKYIQSHKVEIRHYNHNGDFRAQIFLPRRYWLTTGDKVSFEKMAEIEEAGGVRAKLENLRIKNINNQSALFKI